MVKKKISMLLAAVLVASGAALASPVKASADTKTAVIYAAPARTMIETDNKMEFVLQANTDESVEYRVWAQNLQTGKWFELTDGYQLSEVGKNPFKPETTKLLKKGQYKASIWVRKAGSEAKFDTYTVRNFKIQDQGYFNDRANMDDLGIKDTYTVGESISLKGNDQYKLHIFDPSVAVRKDGWKIDADYETAAETVDDFKFEKPGVYLVDVWGKKADSNNKYDGWVLKAVTVTEGTAIPSFTVVEADSTKLPFQTLVQIKLDTTAPENFKVTVADKELELKENAKGEKVFIGVVDGTLDKASVEAKTEIKSLKAPVVDVDVPAVSAVEADSTKLPFQTLVQVKLDTKTPELFNVTVGDKELELKENAKGEKVFIGVVDGTLDNAKAQEQVKVAVK